MTDRVRPLTSTRDEAHNTSVRDQINAGGSCLEQERAAGVDHDVVHWVVIGLGGRGFRAICTCGWRSEPSWKRSDVASLSGRHEEFYRDTPNASKGIHAK